jgi:hypothetical protein
MGTIGTVQAQFQAETRTFTANIDRVKAALGDAASQSEKTSQKIDAAMRAQEAATRRVLVATEKLSGIRPNLNTEAVTAGSLRLTAAVRAQEEAQRQLVSVQKLVRQANLDEAESVQLVAAARAVVQTTTAELTAAKAAEASSAEQAAAAVTEAERRKAAAAEASALKQQLAGQKVTEQSLLTTAALLKQAEAQQQLAQVQELARSGDLSQADALNYQAAVRLKLEAASQAVIRAKRDEAIAVRAAAEEEALSQNAVIRAFQRVAIVARESLGEIRAQLVETAEAAGLEAGSIESAFAGLGKLLGAGLAVGFAANLLDGVAKSEVELDHLSEKTGIGITNLAGLQQIVKELGGDFEPVANGLVKMQKAQVGAVEGSSKLRTVFSELGIPLKELETLTPEQLFVRISQGIAGVQQPAIAANAAIQIFGKSGAALIPIFKSQGDQLESNMQKIGALTGVTEKSADAARRWTADVARLSAQFKSLLIPVLENVEDVTKGVLGSVSAIDTAFEGLSTIVLGTGLAFTSLGSIFEKIATGDFAGAARAKDDFVKFWKDGLGNIQGEWKRTVDLFTKVEPRAPHADGPAEADLGEFEGAGNPGAAVREQREADREQLEAFEQGAEERKAAGQFSVFQENAYWHEKLSSLQKGSANYLRVLEKSNEAEKRLGEVLEKSLHPKKTGDDDAFDKDQIRFADEQARRVEELRQRAAESQSKLVERGQLADVGIAVSNGEISKFQGLVAEARIREAAFATELSIVDKKLAEARAVASLPGLQEEILKLEEQRAKLQEEADQQSVRDRAAIESNTVGGALLDSLHQFEQESEDVAGLVRRTFEETATGINDSLAKALTDPARTSFERIQNLKNSLSGAFRGIANQGIEFSLGKLETSLFKGLGIGGKKKGDTKGDPLWVAIATLEKARDKAGKLEDPLNAGLNKIGISTDSGSVVGKLEGTLVKLFGHGRDTAPGIFDNLQPILGGKGGPAGSAGDPIHVLIDSANAAQGGGFASSISSLLGGGGKGDGSSSDSGSGGGGGGGGIVSLLGLAAGGLGLPGFASGGPIPPDVGAFIVGERGPEILNIGSRGGSVTPNNQLRQLGGGGDTHHNYNVTVDARGATDPAFVHKAVQDGITAAAPHIAAAAVRGVRENRLRTPSTAR